MCDFVQTFYGAALELLNEIRHIALVGDTVSFFFHIVKQF